MTQSDTSPSRRSGATGLVRADPVIVGHRSGISVLDVHGALPAVAGAAREAVLARWARCPGAVVCDLSAVTGPFETGAIALLASLGAEVRQWPGIPIGFVCPDRTLGEPLAGAAEGQHLLLRYDRASMWAALAGREASSTVSAVLAPEPASARAAREMVGDACTDWGAEAQIPTAALVTSELVSNAVVHAGTLMEVSFSRCGGQLRLAVRDDNPRAPAPSVVGSEDSHGRGLLLIAALCTSWGVVPTSTGKVVWAVLRA